MMRTISAAICRCASAGLVLAVAASAVPAFGYDRYDPGCSRCHGGFSVTPYASPKGGRWPGSLHEVHRGASFMASDCGLCHTSGDQRNPYLGRSDGAGSVTGRGCTGCHGALEGTVARAEGLRNLHAANGVSVCAGCHAARVSPSESVRPPYYGTSSTRVDSSCNDDPATSEDWSGDALGLDNDGDGKRDVEDSDCAGEPADAGASADAGSSADFDAGSVPDAAPGAVDAGPAPDDAGGADSGQVDDGGFADSGGANDVGAADAGDAGGASDAGSLPIADASEFDAGNPAGATPDATSGAQPDAGEPAGAGQADGALPASPGEGGNQGGGGGEGAASEGELAGTSVGCGCFTPGAHATGGALVLILILATSRRRRPAQGRGRPLA